MLKNHSLPVLWRWTDLALVLGIFGITVALVAGYHPAPGKNAVISVDGKAVAAYSLGNPEQEIAVNGALGPVVIQVGGGRVRIVKAPCPHQLCVKQGGISAAGQALVCLPSRLMIVVTGPDSEKTDALAY